MAGGAREENYKLWWQEGQAAKKGGAVEEGAEAEEGAATGEKGGNNGKGARGGEQGSKFRSNFGEISVNFSFSLDTGKRNFGIFRFKI